jgi:hypothetical protein
MKKTFVAIVCVLGLVLIATNARAITIPLAFGDGRYVGLIVDGIPSSDALELGYVGILIAQTPGTGPTVNGTETYTRSALTPLPPVIAFLGRDIDAPLNWTVGTDDPFYILGKYGSSGSYVWLVDATIGDTITLQSKFDINENGGGLSHISGFSTPIPGAVWLFGSGMAGLVGIARFRRKGSK